MNISLPPNWTESASMDGMEALHQITSNCSDVVLGKYWCTPMFSAIGVIIIIGFVAVLAIQLIPERWLR